MDLSGYFGEWMKVVDERELHKIVTILNPLYNNGNITPNKKDVFKAFLVCQYKDLKIVMLGQDPYPQKGIAIGVLFGNSLETPEAKLSPSLKVIIEGVIDHTVPQDEIIFDYSLESWAKQGILLINSALTVEINRVGSHAQLWRHFIAKLFQNLSEINPGLVYILFGKQAQTFIPYIGKTNYLINCDHPAYNARMGTHMDSEIFKEANRILKRTNNTSIKWY